MKRLNLPRIERHYRIDVNGQIWSYRINGYLRQSVHHGYAFVVLPDIGKVLVQTLMALKYMGPRNGRVVWHKDDNSLNNALNNLEYIERRVAVHRGRNRGKMRTFVLPDVMPDPRLKPVICDGKRFASVAECALELGMTRTGVYKAIKRGGCRYGDIGFARS